jgi:uncharacterized peroxidase-related enzyme
MRLPSLSRAWRLGDRLKLRVIRLASGRPPADILHVFHYRREHFGDPFTDWVHHVLRGPSEWTVGERELMATFVSRLNQCRFCADSHAAIVDASMGPDIAIAIERDWRTAPLPPRLMAILVLLEVLTLRPQEFGPAQLAAARAAGITEAGVRDAIHLCAIFCTINRIADAIDFAVPNAQARAADAKVLLRRGYGL